MPVTLPRFASVISQFDASKHRPLGQGSGLPFAAAIYKLR